MRFILNGCDISFIAEAPENMTVKQLVEQADRIKPYWCACGICKDTEYKNVPTEIIFDYNDVRKANDDVSCKIRNDKKDSKVNDIKEESTGNFCMNCEFASNMGKENYYYCLLKGLAVTYKFNTCDKYEKEK